MTIAYLTTYDSTDKNQWSGLGYYVGKCLSDQNVELIPVNCEVQYSFWLKLKAKMIMKLSGKVYQRDRDHAYLKKVALLAEKKLKEINYDVIVSPGSLAITYVNTAKPIVFWTDATYAVLVDFYPAWKNLSKQTKINGNVAEQRAIEKAALIFYTSAWAMKSAMTNYGAPAAKLAEIPFGSNFEGHKSLPEITQLIEKRLANPEINLLFVGVEWERKGAELAVETVINLRSKGINATLTITGCTLIDKYKNSPFIKNFPFISKNTQEGIEKLSGIYESATFFILPTRADCFPVVFAEACSYGLPIISSNVGGCLSAIKDDLNGYCLRLEDFPETAAAKLISMIESPEKYKKISLNSFDQFQVRLNWNVIGEKALKLIENIVK